LTWNLPTNCKNRIKRDFYLPFYFYGHEIRAFDLSICIATLRPPTSVFLSYFFLPCSLSLSLAKLSTSFTINSTSKKTTTTNYTPGWMVRGNHLQRPKDLMHRKRHCLLVIINNIMREAIVGGMASMEYIFLE